MRAMGVGQCGSSAKTQALGNIGGGHVGHILALGHGRLAGKVAGLQVVRAVPPYNLEQFTRARGVHKLMHSLLVQLGYFARDVRSFF